MTLDRRTQRQLRDGLAAVRAGKRERARGLLQQVVEAAPETPEAWWGLSQAADNPTEQARALERVVALDPDHGEARSRLVKLRLQHLPAAASPPPPLTVRLPAGMPHEAEDGIDNPYQCPYCGQVTGPDDRRCDHCRGHLFRRVAVEASSETLRRLTLVLGINLAVGILELAAPLLALGYHQGNATPANYDWLRHVPGVQPVLGDFLALGPADIDFLLKTLAARAAVFVALTLGLRLRWRLAYYGAMLGLVADLGFSLYLLASGYLGWAGLLLNLVLSLGAGVILFAVSYEFAVNHERLLVRPDASARSPLDFFQRGHAYRRQGLWALAVAQWRKAVGLAPHEAEYYKALGIGYAQIRRFDRSLRALHEGRRRSADPAELDRLIALVEAEAKSERR